MKILKDKLEILREAPKNEKASLKIYSDYNLRERLIEIVNAMELKMRTDPPRHNEAIHINSLAFVEKDHEYQLRCLKHKNSARAFRDYAKNFLSKEMIEEYEKRKRFEEEDGA